MFLASLLLAAAVSQPQPLTDPEYGPAPGYRGAAAVASDGENFLAAWNDQRTQPDLGSTA